MPGRGGGMRVAVACAVLALSVVCRGVPPERESLPDLPAARRAVISAPGDTPRTIAYWSNANPSEAAGRTHAVIVIHGDQRNAAAYFAFTRSAARIAGSDAIIIAPRFVTTDDRGREATDATWSEDTGRAATRAVATLSARSPWSTASSPTWPRVTPR